MAATVSRPDADSMKWTENRQVWAIGFDIAGWRNGGGSGHD
jgi:hypothetical protein